jgi:hypothetical protein
MRPDPDAASDLRALAYADHLLIWTFRAYAVGRWRCAMIEREYRDACGAAAAEARDAVRVFAQASSAQTRRTIVLSRPGVITLTRDEQLLLAVYAAAQNDDAPKCEAHLAWLLARSPGPPLFAAARVTASALLREGHRLSSVPVAFAPPSAAAGALAEAHG